MFDYKRRMYIDSRNYIVGCNIIIGVFLFVFFGLLIEASWIFFLIFDIVVGLAIFGLNIGIKYRNKFDPYKPTLLHNQLTISTKKNLAPCPSPSLPSSLLYPHLIFPNFLLFLFFLSQAYKKSI